MSKSAFEFEGIIVDAKGQEIECYQGSAQQEVIQLGQDTVLEMVAIAGGTFTIGAPKSEAGWHSTQSPQRQVSVSSFFMSKYPITQAQWQAVASFSEVNEFLVPNPSSFKGSLRPVEQVSWYDAVEFCARLSQYTGNQYRLPSEAEWEYACRASTQTPFHFGETITTDLANYSGVDWEYLGKVCSRGAYGAGPTGEDRRETTPVGSFGVANQVGLYDMHGLVWEWCADSWHSNHMGVNADGTARISQINKRVLRGGSWNVGPKKCRCAYRTKFDADASLYDIGFRIVATQGDRG